MGRHYHGHINGKFWFGCQSSGAMKDYGAEEQPPNFQYHVCGCSCEFTVPDEKDYCKDCYDSYEDHIKEAREDYDELTECFEEDVSCIDWLYERDTFERQGLPFIQEHEELFNKYIESITFDWRIAYDIKWVKEEYSCGRHDDDKILADLCMLKQIQHFFQREDDDTCLWEAEY